MDAHCSRHGEIMTKPPLQKCLFFSFWKCSHRSSLNSPFKVWFSCKKLPLVWVLGNPMQWLIKVECEVLSIFAKAWKSQRGISFQSSPWGGQFDFCNYPVLLPLSTFHQCWWYILEFQCFDCILLDMLNSKFQSSTISHQGHDPNPACLLGQGI